MDGLSAGLVLYRNFDAKFDKILTNTKTVRKIGVSFVIKNGVITATDEDNNIASVKIFSGDTPKDLNKTKQMFINQLSKTGNSDYYTVSTTIEDDIIPFLPVSNINELRRNILNLLSKERLSNFRASSQKPIKYSKFPTAKVDYRANISNSEAKSFYENCQTTVSEPALEVSPEISKGIELMRTKHSLKFAANLCNKPCKNLFLTDDKGKKYPLKFDCKNCEMVILNP